MQQTNPYRQNVYLPSVRTQGAVVPNISQPTAPTYGAFNNYDANSLQNYVNGLKSVSGINNTWAYDDTTGLYVNPLTGAYSNGDPSSTFQLDQANAKTLASAMRQYGISANDLAKSGALSPTEYTQAFRPSNQYKGVANTSQYYQPIYQAQYQRYAFPSYYGQQSNPNSQRINDLQRYLSAYAKSPTATSTHSTSTPAYTPAPAPVINTQPNMIYDDTTGLYINPFTGGYVSQPTPFTPAETTTSTPAPAPVVSTPAYTPAPAPVTNTHPNLIYDDTTGLYINPLTGAYSYKKGGIVSLTSHK